MLELVQLIITALLALCAIAIFIANIFALNVPAILIGLVGIAFSSFALPVAWYEFKKVIDK